MSKVQRGNRARPQQCEPFNDECVQHKSKTAANLEMFRFACARGIPLDVCYVSQARILCRLEWVDDEEEFYFDLALDRKKGAV